MQYPIQKNANTEKTIIAITYTIGILIYTHFFIGNININNKILLFFVSLFRYFTSLS